MSRQIIESNIMKIKGELFIELFEKEINPKKIRKETDPALKVFFEYF